MSNTCNASPDDRKIGEVILLKKDKAFVKILSFNACSSCGITSCKSSQPSKKPIWVLNEISAKKGDRVIIEQSGKSYVFSAVVIFIVPILLLLVSLLIFQNYLADTPALLISMAIAISYFITGKFSGFFKIFENNWAYKAIMVLPNNANPDEKKAI